MSEQPEERAPRTRRTLIVALVVVVIAAGAWFGVGAFRSEYEQALVDETSGLTLTPPPGWTFEPADYRRMFGDVGSDPDVVGYVLSSGSVGDLRDGWAIGPEIPEGVAVVSVIGGWVPDPGGSSVPGWPLSFEMDDRPPQITGAADDLSFDHRGYSWEVVAWHADETDDDVAAAVDGLVASITLASLADPPEGTAVLDHGVLSLGPSERFPVGSVTTVQADMGDGILDTFVVSAPGGPYGIDTHQFDGCDLVWSPIEEAFSSGSKRWDIRGEPLTPGAGVIVRTRDGGVDPDGRMWLSYLGSGGRPIDTAGYWDEPVP